MLIACPNCATSYQVDSASLGAGGRSVRCARCRTVWFATPVTELATAVAEGDAGSAAGANGRKQDDWGSYTPWDEAQAAEDTVDTAPDQAVDDAAADAWNVSADGADPGQADAIASVEAPSLVPADGAAQGAFGHGREAADGAGADIESFAARRERQHKQRRLQLRSHGFLALIAVLVTIEGALIAWRGNVVALLPQTASFFSAIGLPVNVRGLAFDGVASTTEVLDGATILVVEGAIVNPARKAIEVPRLRFAIRDQRGHEISSWTALPARPSLAPGESLPFRSRLASPPAEAHDVVVRFFTRRDAPAPAAR